MCAWFECHFVITAASMVGSGQCDCLVSPIVINIALPMQGIVQLTSSQALHAINSRMTFDPLVQLLLYIPLLLYGYIHVHMFAEHYFITRIILYSM